MVTEGGKAVSSWDRKTILETCCQRHHLVETTLAVTFFFLSVVLSHSPIVKETGLFCCGSPG